MEAAVDSDHDVWLGSAAAGRTAGTRLHTSEHKTLLFLKIDARIHKHGTCLFLQKYFQTIQLYGRIARLGCFGYVHSQRGASAAWNDEDTHAVSGSALLCNDFLELAHCTIR